MPDLEELDCLIESPTAVNGKLSRRPAAAPFGSRRKILGFRKVRDYFETMMQLIGHRPLPAAPKEDL